MTSEIWNRKYKFSSTYPYQSVEPIPATTERSQTWHIADTENWHSELCLWIVGGSHTERPRPGVGADLRTFWLWGISATFTLIYSLFNRSHTSSGKNYCLLGLLYLNFTQLSATSGRHIGSHGRQFRDGGEELHLDLLFLHLRRFRTQSACLLGTFPWRFSNHSWVKLDPEETSVSIHFIQTELLALDFVGLLSFYCLEMFDFSSLVLVFYINYNKCKGL